MAYGVASVNTILENDKASILYVDDEQQNLDVFKMAYRRYFNIYTATTAKDAIKILHEHPVDTILADQRMPEMTGVQFFEAINSVYPDPTRMLISGYSDADAIINAINKGHIFRFIAKPWDEEELKQSLYTAVRMYQLVKKNRDLIQQMHDEAIKQERILSLFSKYVPSKVIGESIKEDPEHLFDGELRVISVLFVTIKDHNKLLEKNDPKQTLSYINQYVSLMARCIEEHRGMVDKVIGGSVLAIFGAPISYIDNSKNAVLAALCMQEAIKKLNSDFENKLGFKAEIGIGIHSGEAIVGNIGSQQYITYTAIGDTVNTASRITELTNQLDNAILIGESTYQAIKNEMQIEPMGEKAIRGKTNSINIYKVLNKKL